MTSSTQPTEGTDIMATASINSDTRTIHTLHIEIPDDIVGKIAPGDQVEVMFNSRASKGRYPRPQMLSWAQLRWITGQD
jgi:hypothetical protein